MSILAHPTLNTGLLRHWGFENTVVDEVGGIGFTATTPIQYGIGLTGRSITTDTTVGNAYLQTNDFAYHNFTTATPHSVSFWFQLKLIPSFQESIYTTATSVGNWPIFSVVVSPAGQVSIQSPGPVQVVGSPAVNGAWTHIVLSTNGTLGDGNTDIYINGVWGADTAGTAPPVQTTAIRIYRSARYDQLSYWNRKITVAEITSLYNSGAGLPYSLGIGVTRGTANAEGAFVGAFDPLVPTKIALAGGRMTQTVATVAPAGVAPVFSGRMVLAGGPGSSVRDSYFRNVMTVTTTGTLAVAQTAVVTAGTANAGGSPLAVVPAAATRVVTAGTANAEGGNLAVVRAASTRVVTAGTANAEGGNLAVVQASATATVTAGTANAEGGTLAVVRAAATAAITAGTANAEGGTLAVVRAASTTAVTSGTAQAQGGTVAAVASAVRKIQVFTGSTLSTSQSIGHMGASYGSVTSVKVQDGAAFKTVWTA